MNGRFLWALFICGASLGQSRLPSSPERPSLDDCRALAGQFYKVLGDLHKENVQCLRNPTSFGFAESCSGGTEYVAWTECQPLALKICRVNETKDREGAVCSQRANQLKLQQDQEKKHGEEVTAQLKAGNDLTDKASRLYSALKDPVSFLKKAVVDDSGLLKSLFPTQGTARTPINEPLAQELYRFAQNYTKVGLQTTSNPIVRSIQKTSLERIGEMHKEVLSNLNAVSSDIREMGSSFQTPIISAPVRQPIRKSTEPAECAVFENEEASRALMRKDNARWLALYEKCQK